MALTVWDKFRDKIDADILNRVVEAPELAASRGWGGVGGREAVGPAPLVIPSAR